MLLLEVYTVVNSLEITLVEKSELAKGFEDSSLSQTWVPEPSSSPNKCSSRVFKSP